MNKHRVLTPEQVKEALDKQRRVRSPKCIPDGVRVRPGVYIHQGMIIVGDKL